MKRTRREELERDALTAPAAVPYDSPFEGVETKGLWRGRGSPYCVARRARHGAQRAAERGRLPALQPSTPDDRRGRAVDADLLQQVRKVHPGSVHSLIACRTTRIFLARGFASPCRSIST